LVDYNYYDYSLDIWSTGAMFASMVHFINIMYRYLRNNHFLWVKVIKINL